MHLPALDILVDVRQTVDMSVDVALRLLGDTSDCRDEQILCKSLADRPSNTVLGDTNISLATVAQGDSNIGTSLARLSGLDLGSGHETFTSQVLHVGEVVLCTCLIGLANCGPGP